MRLLPLVALVAACQPGSRVVAVTFNTGTNPGQKHDDPPDDGCGSAQAALSDQYYGDGLAWPCAIADVAAFVARETPDVMAFQEIVPTRDCATIPPAAWPGFVCETWKPGDPSVVQMIVGEGYQVACNTGKPDKCVAVRRSFGTFRGCASALCLDGLAGSSVPGCGGGARVGRGVIELSAGGTLTVVNIHGTSGIAAEDRACRVKQAEQAFAGLSGALVLGDLSTDPGRFAPSDESATRTTGTWARGCRSTGSRPSAPTPTRPTRSSSTSTTWRATCTSRAAAGPRA